MLARPISTVAKRVSSGLTPLRSNLEFWQNGTIQWLKTEQLGEKFIYSTTEKISETALRKTKIKVYPPNTLSIAMYGEGKTRGNVSIIKSEMATNQACCNVELDPDLADYEYVYYFLKTQYNELRNLSSGVRKNLNSDDIKNFVIRLPEALSEQKKIADVLAALDAKIECNARINAELEAMAKTLYDYWFVQFEFPDENGNPYKSSGGKMIYNLHLKKGIPEEWEFGTFSALVETNPQDKLLNGCLAPHIEMRAVPEIGSCIANITQKIVSSGTKFRNNDVLLARITPCLENGKTALVQGLTDNIVGHGSTEFVVLRSKYLEAEGLIYLTARNKDFRTYCISNMTGTSGRKRISGAQVGAYKMAVPPAKVVRQFAQQTTNIFKKISVLHQENQQLTQLRDWLLPMLMNGQVTVG